MMFSLRCNSLEISSTVTLVFSRVCTTVCPCHCHECLTVSQDRRRGPDPLSELKRWFSLAVSPLRSFLKRKSFSAFLHPRATNALHKTSHFCVTALSILPQLIRWYFFVEPLRCCAFSSVLSNFLIRWNSARTIHDSVCFEGLIPRLSLSVSGWCCTLACVSHRVSAVSWWVPVESWWVLAEFQCILTAPGRIRVSLGWVVWFHVGWSWNFPGGPRQVCFRLCSWLVSGVARGCWRVRAEHTGGLVPGRGTNSRCARAPYDRAMISVNSREMLVISRVDTLGGSVTMSMNFTLYGRSRKTILETE